MVRGTSDRGSVVPIVALLLVGLMLSVTMIGVTAERSVRAARAQWAADAAALGAAGSGPFGTDEVAARMVAEANGAQLIAVEVVAPGGEGAGADDEPALLSPVVVVEVEFDGVRARSAARRFAVDGP